jgi:hypothetical protein
MQVAWLRSLASVAGLIAARARKRVLVVLSRLRGELGIRM